jgi:hypothetical protein
MPTFPALRELKLECITIPDDLGPLLAVIASAPLLESLLLIDIEVEPADDVSPCTKTLIHLPALRTILVRSDILFTYALLQRIPDPATNFRVDLATYSNDYLLPTEESLPIDNEVFNRVLTFWKRKTGGQCLPLGHFIFTHPELNSFSNMPRVQFGGIHMDFCFRSVANIDMPHLFWPHVETLHLKYRISTEVLLPENIHSILRISALIIEMDQPQARDIQAVHEWLFNCACAFSNRFVIRKIIFVRCFDDWKDLTDEIKAVTPNIQVDATNAQYVRYV